MEMFGHIAIAILSLVITLAANTAAHLMPRNFMQTPQATASAPPSSEAGVEYGSLQSSSLGKELKFAVQLPPSYKTDAKRRYAVLYFLHGMFGNEGEFQRRGVAAKVASLREQGLIGECIIIAPAGGNSFYLHAENGVRYEGAIIQALSPHIEKTYRATGPRDGRAIQGISMGGWGALMLA